MSWDMLPSDISIYIFKIRNNIRNNASNIIKNAWKNYIIHDIWAIDLALMIETDQFDEIMVSIQQTATLLKYSLSLCSGRFYLEFWKLLATKLSNSLEIYRYPDNQWLTQEAVNYRKIKIQYNKLLKKFNFCIKK